MHDEGLDTVLRFGALMLRAGDTAFRVRESMTVAARGLGLGELSLQIGLGSMMASEQRGGECATALREIGPFGVDTQRIGALEALAHSASAGMTAQEFAVKLSAIEAQPPRYSIFQVGAAIAVACGSFAFLNGGSGLEIAGAALGGGAGQGLRTLLLRRHLNQYLVAALSACLAVVVCCLVSLAGGRMGLGVTRDTVGLVSSVLFLVPGFPLLAALLDLLQHETAAALARLTYAAMLLLNAALGLSVVIALLGVSLTGPEPLAFDQPLLSLLRAAASFAGASGFAVLFNSKPRSILYIGLLAVVGNELRLTLRDVSLSLPTATFLGALAVGLSAHLLRRLKEPRIALSVPGVIMMVPGLYSVEALVRFNRDEVQGGLQALALVGFALGAMAMGLAAARFITEPAWLKK
jgi:uncharacterized membrane protein YjjP (DUF1212 family)